MRQLGYAFSAYTKDYDGKFPAADLPGRDPWPIALLPYVRSMNDFQCVNTKLHSLKKTDYYFNANMTSARETSILFPKSTIVVGEGNDDSPLNYVLSDLPKVWRDDEKSPANRHYYGGIYLFADGHEKAVKPEKITLNSPTGKNFTFLTR